MKSFENEVFRNLDKKANITDLTSLLSQKADLAQTTSSLQNKVNIQDFESVRLNLDRINKDIINKIDMNKFEAYMNDTRSAIEETQKELMLKANMKELVSLLSKKADIEKVNEALIQVTDDLDQKCGVENVIIHPIILNNHLIRK